MSTIASTMVVGPASAVLEVLMCYSSSSLLLWHRGTAHDVVQLQTATRVDNQIIFDIMLNVIIVVVTFISSTINRIAATITIAMQPS